MKRSALLRHLRYHGCYLKREGRSHSLWCNPKTGHVEAVPKPRTFGAGDWRLSGSGGRLTIAGAGRVWLRAASAERQYAPAALVWPQWPAAQLHR